MWVKPVYSLVLACVGVAGLAFVLFPDAFVVRANPTLQLLKKHLPDWLALRLIQVFGAFVLLSALFFLYVLYVPL